MKQVLIFAGTTEGRRLSEALSRASVPVLVCVATEYGETLLPEGEGIVRRAGRLTEEEMETLMKSGDFSCVADATHPYAKAVSENIRKAAEEAGLPCFRLLREELHPALEEQAVFVDSVEEAARFLQEARSCPVIRSLTSIKAVSLPGFFPQKVLWRRPDAWDLRDGISSVCRDRFQKK